MLGRTTRLEFIIVTVAFMVLMLCSKPPQRGSAEIEDLGQGVIRTEDIENPVPAPLPLPSMSEPETSVDDSEATEIDDTALQLVDIAPSEPVEQAPPQPPRPRIATVDARNCQGLQYDDIMAGEITVRWVWNGQELVPEKVCVVREPDGTTTVWRFNQPGQAVLSEIDSVEKPTP